MTKISRPLSTLATWLPSLREAYKKALAANVEHPVAVLFEERPGQFFGSVQEGAWIAEGMAGNGLEAMAKQMMGKAPDGFVPAVVVELNADTTLMLWTPEPVTGAGNASPWLN